MNPYQVATLDQLNAVGSALSSYFIQTADINGNGANFNPIGAAVNQGDRVNEFTGTYDGNGFKIQNLNIIANPLVNSLGGLFAWTASKSLLQNMDLEGINVTAGISTVGGLAGENDGTIQSSYVNGTISGYTTGGLVGQNNGSVISCHTSGTISGNGMIGGLVGANGQIINLLHPQIAGGSIQNSYSTCTINGDLNAGGLVGQNNPNSSIQSCYASGAVKGESNIGGLVGINGTVFEEVQLPNEWASINGSFATGTVTSQATTESSTQNIGGLVGQGIWGNITNSYATGMVTSGPANEIGGLVGGFCAGTISHCYATGAVSSGANSQDTGGLVGSCWEYNPGNSEYPIAYSVDTCFATGPVSGGTEAGGLIGLTDEYGSLTVCYSSGAVSGWKNVGGFIGSSGLSDIPYRSSLPSGYFAQDPKINTGLNGVGAGDGSGVYAATPAQLEQQATFAPSGWDFGGTWTTLGNTTTPLLKSIPVIITGTTPGVMDTVALISSGTVLAQTTAIDNAYRFSIDFGQAQNGLLVTDVTGNAANSFSETNLAPAGAIVANLTKNTLAFTGYGQVNHTSMKATVGSLSASKYGFNFGVSGTNLTLNSGVSLVVSSPYTMDGNLSVPDSATFNAGTVILANHNCTAGSFILQSSTTWEQVVGQNGLTALPSLSVGGDFELQGSSTFLRSAGGMGTATSPYKINDLYSLEGIGSPSNSLLGNNYILTVSTLNATGANNWKNGFVPIGNPANPFTGNFNGGWCVISNLTIKQPSQNDIGLFGATKTINATNPGIIQAIGLNQERLTGNSFVGGVVGLNGGTVQSCYDTGDITGTTAVGGLIGSNTGNVAASYTTTDVDGTTQVGGLAGLNTGTIATSYASGPVNADTVKVGNQVGGLVGNNGSGGIIQTSYELGTVNGVSDVGGLVGNNQATVQVCYQVGLATGGGTNVGALIGSNTGTLIANYYEMEPPMPGIGNERNGATGATGLVLKNMRNQSTYQPAGTGATNWNFTPKTGIWSIYPNQTSPQYNYGLPYLP